MEASYHQVTVRVEELKRFLDMTKTYSIKTSSHIKIITSLVNELTDSDDTLVLIDKEIQAAITNSKYTHTTNLNRMTNRQGGDLTPNSPINRGITQTGDRRSTFDDDRPRSVNFNERPANTSSTHENTKFQPNIEIKNNVSRSGEEAALAKMLETYRHENQKLWDNLKKGQSDTDFIKGVFEKLLDTFTKQKPETSQLMIKQERDSIQPCSCANCVKVLSQQQPNFVPQGVSQSCYVPNNQGKRKPNCLHGNNGFDVHEEESMRSMKEGPEADASRRRPNDSGINGMFKQYLELKKEFERVTEDKNRQINDLTRLLEETRGRSETLLREVEELARHKTSLEASARDLISQTKLNAEKTNGIFEQKARNLEKEVQRLEALVNSLSAENDGLRRQTKDNERWKTEEDFYKVKLAKLENDYGDLQRNFLEAKNRNGELVSLLEKSNEARTKSKVISETSTIDYNDDLLKCMYSQADYIEAGMGAFFNDSIFKN